MRREAGDKQAIVLSLDAHGKVAAILRQPERAVRLLAAASAARASVGVTPQPSDARELEVALATARAALTEPAFITSWAEGEALSLQQAIDCALNREVRP